MIMTLSIGVLSLGRYHFKFSPAVFPMIRYMQFGLPGRASVFRVACRNQQARGHATLKRLGLGVSESCDHSIPGSMFTRAESPCLQLFIRAGSLHHRQLTKAGFHHHQLLTSRLEAGAGLQTLYVPAGQLRWFHTTPKRNIPPLFWVLIKPVAKLGAILTGRYFGLSTSHKVLLSKFNFFKGSFEK